MDLTFDPILLLVSLDSLCASCTSIDALDALLLCMGGDSRLAGGGESRFGDLGPSEDILLPVSASCDDCGVRNMVGVRG